MRATMPHSIAQPLRPIASDYTPSGRGVRVDWLALGAFPAVGVFARACSSRDERPAWGTLGASPAAAAALITTRSGDTPNADDGSRSAPAPLGAGGAIQSPPRR